MPKHDHRGKTFLLQAGLLACAGLLTLASSSGTPALDQVAVAATRAGLMRFPDVSASQIVFMYANDLWIVAREGGLARPLVQRAGQEIFPKFSPDGKTIAFMADFAGNRDLYTIAPAGGVPVRLTHHPAAERLCDWTPDGRLLFSMNGLAGLADQRQLFSVSSQGGLPVRVPVPYGFNGAISPDGQWLAWVLNGSDFYQWRGYRGGEATDIWLYNFHEKTFRQITDWAGTDAMPMWQGNTIYYLSDAGAETRLNLWSFDLLTGRRQQITAFKEFDVKWPSLGPGQAGKGEIVFQYGAALYLLDLATEQTRAVSVTIPTAQTTIPPKVVDSSQNMASVSISADGARVALEARGDVWTASADDKSPRNLTRTSGTAERVPAWSPDGRWIAYFSDANGEYELYMMPTNGKGEAKQLTRGGQVFSAEPVWSPDSTRIVFTSVTGRIFLHTLATGETKLVDSDPFSGGWNRIPAVSWSSDSRWLAYAKSNGRTPLRAIWLYRVATGETHQVTSGMFNDTVPVFDRSGKYLFYKSSRHFQPTFADNESSFIYAGTQSLMAVPLQKESSNQSASRAMKQHQTVLDLDGFEKRAFPLPVPKGRFGKLAVNDKGWLFYLRFSSTENELPALRGFNLTDAQKKERQVINGVSDFDFSADGKKLLVRRGAALFIGTVGGQARPVNTSAMRTTINPREEWQQIFREAWRLYRDFFYDPKMRGVDWLAVRERYAPLIAACASREDVDAVLRQMIAELGVSHARVRLVGDVEEVPAVSVGMLGVDFELHNGAYRIAKMYEGASWDAEARNPLRGVNVKEGDYLLAVNRVPLDPKLDPWAAFRGLANQVVTLTISTHPTLDPSARQVSVRTLSSEAKLRARAWVENNRALVEQKTNGRVGYIYLSDLTNEGLSELGRQFYGQMDKEALIVDVRWNVGGSTPDRFFELLNRPILHQWVVRYGAGVTVPIYAHAGQKCLLINGGTGSNAETFAYYFRKAELGKLIGARTWGGVTGSAGSPMFIDGGAISIPHHAFYEKGKEAGIEGHGVESDIRVPENPALLVNGHDPQLEAAIQQMLVEIQQRGH